MSVTLITTPILAKPRSIDLSTPFLISPPFTPYEPLPSKKRRILVCDLYAVMCTSILTHTHGRRA